MLELDGAMVAAIGTVATAAAGGLAKVFYADRREIIDRMDRFEGKLEECNEKHTAERYRTGALEATVSILSERQPPEVRAQVKQALIEASEKVEELKTTPPVKKSH